MNRWCKCFDVLVECCHVFDRTWTNHLLQCAFSVFRYFESKLPLLLLLRQPYWVKAFLLGCCRFSLYVAVTGQLLVHIHQNWEHRLRYSCSGYSQRSQIWDTAVNVFVHSRRHQLSTAVLKVAFSLSSLQLNCVSHPSLSSSLTCTLHKVINSTAFLSCICRCLSLVIYVRQGIHSEALDLISLSKGRKEPLFIRKSVQ